jgi:hypothetical protein
MTTIAEWNRVWGSLLIAFAVLLLVGAGLELLAFDRGGWHAQYTLSAAVRRWSRTHRWVVAVVVGLLAWLVVHLWFLPVI